MTGRRQGEQRWRGSLMAVINDNGPEESRDTGATYIIPSHQTVHLHGLFSANQHSTARRTHAHTHTPHLLLGSAPAEDSQTSLYGFPWMIAKQGNDM